MAATTANGSTRRRKAAEPPPAEEPTATTEDLNNLPLEAQARVLIDLAMAKNDAAALRVVFHTYYAKLGWKNLCRMWVMGEDADSVMDRRERAAAR